MTLRKAQVGETLWFGLPVMPLRLTSSVRITGARLNDQLPVDDVAFFDMQLYGPNDARHVTVLPDIELRDDHFTVGPSLFGTRFQPGRPTHYGLMRLKFTQPGRYTLGSVTLDYTTDSGGTGTQRINQTFEIHVQRSS